MVKSPSRGVQARPIREPECGCRRSCLDERLGTTREMQAASQTLGFLQGQRHYETSLLRLNEGLRPHQLTNLPG